MYDEITIDDIRETLSSTSQVPSKTGIVLDRLRAGLVGSGDLGAAKEHVEHRLMRYAKLYRCVGDMCKYEKFVGCNVPYLCKASVEARVGEGLMAAACLSSYERWCKTSDERGYAEICATAKSVGSRVPDANVETLELTQSFREGKCLRARRFATRLLDDSERAISRWLIQWNQRNA